LNFKGKVRGEVPGAKSESKVSSKSSAKSESKLSSKYRGVSKKAGSHHHGNGKSRVPQKLKWQVHIACEGTNKFLGYFDDEVEAALAYDASAVRYKGKAAVLNFPEKCKKGGQADHGSAGGGTGVEERASKRQRVDGAIAGGSMGSGSRPGNEPVPQRPPPKKLSSTLRGVSWNKGSGRWEANISHNNKARYLGSFQDEVAAALAYDEAATRLKGTTATLNFENVEAPRANSKPAGGKASKQVMQAKKSGEAGAAATKTPHSSQYRGVSWNKVGSRWRVNIAHEGKQDFLGHFDSEIEGARAYDIAATKKKGSKAILNFGPSFKEAVRHSKYRGVTKSSNHTRITKWQSQIGHGGKTKHIGYYDTEIEAARAYNRMANELKGAGAVLNLDI